MKDSVFLIVPSAPPKLGVKSATTMWPFSITPMESAIFVEKIMAGLRIYKLRNVLALLINILMLVVEVSAKIVPLLSLAV